MSLLSRLPDEIVREVLKYIATASTTVDYVNFFEAYEQFEHLRVIRVINKIDLSHCYRINIDILLSTINCNAVTSVNINNCQWLSKSTLHYFISQLPNVQVLSALKTKLDLTEDDIEILNKTNIHRLAVTLKKERSGEKQKSLLKIKELYLEIDEVTSKYFQTDFNTMVQFPNLEQVWIKYLGYKQLDNFSIENWLNNRDNYKLRSATIWQRHRAMCMPRRWKLLLVKFYENDTLHWPKITCYEKNYGLLRQLFQRRLDDSHQLPVGPIDARKLYIDEQSLETMKCKEFYLDFTLRNAHICRKMLETQAESVETLGIFDDPFSRYGASMKSFHDDFNRMTNVKQLAVHSNFIANTNLHFISKFTQLKFLHVGTQESTNLDFLPVIFRHCKSLEKLSLNITSLRDNSLVHFNEALKQSTDLKELFLQCSECVEIDEIISILNARKEIKLRRLWILVGSCKDLNIEIWKEYFEHNEQLMDCVVGVRHPLPSHWEKADELCTLYERPHRQLLRFYVRLFVPFHYNLELDLEAEICNNFPCGMKIDDDFFDIC